MHLGLAVSIETNTFCFVPPSTLKPLNPTPPRPTHPLQANPSLAEKMYQQFRAKKEQLNTASKEDIMAKYGSAAEKPPDDLLMLGGTEKYVEYDRMGRVVKGQVREWEGLGDRYSCASCWLRHARLRSPQPCKTAAPWHGAKLALPPAFNATHNLRWMASACVALNWAPRACLHMFLSPCLASY